MPNYMVFRLFEAIREIGQVSSEAINFCGIFVKEKEALYDKVRNSSSDKLLNSIFAKYQ